MQSIDGIAFLVGHSPNAVLMSSRRCAYGSIKALAGFQHRVHDESEFARHRDRGPLEADLLPQLQSPGAKCAVGKASRQ